MISKNFSSGYIICTLVFCAVLTFCAHGAGVVPPGTTQLAEGGSSGAPAKWWLDGDYISPSGSVFTVGGSWNRLTVNNGYDFIASDGMAIGTTAGENNLLNIQAGSTVTINGTFICGQTTSISYNSRLNKTVVSGTGARLQATGTIQIGSGAAWLVTNNTLNISNKGVVIANSDKDGVGGFGVANHWSYGNSWLELDGGLLAIYGDTTANFTYGAGILSSIKVWDDVSSSFQRLAYYNSTTWIATEYIDLLSVEYVVDAVRAAELGVSDEFVGFTVVQNVPEPATLILMTLCSTALISRRRPA